MKEASWTDGKRTVKGRWSYYRPGDYFDIELDVRDSITGSRTRRFTVHGDEPEWGKFVRTSEK